MSQSEEKQELKSLGWANGWSSTPSQVLEARDKGYKVYETNIGRCLTQYSCPEGGWYYIVDSSD